MRILLFCLLSLSLMANDEPKVVVLGFDGVDAKLTQKWMEEGKLPNLQKLSEEGTFSPLRTTVPSQTPVSWSTFATGLNPGRHNIFDFLKRDPKTYKPSFAAFEQRTVPMLWGEKNGLYLGVIGGAVLFLLSLVILKVVGVRMKSALFTAVVIGGLGGTVVGIVADRMVPKQRPLAVNRQEGQTLWEALGEHGKRVRVVRLPVTFPPEPFPHGELLTGLGTPDTSLRIGKPFFFTSELFFKTNTGGEFSVEVVQLEDNKGKIETEIKGPPNRLFPDGEPYITIPMTLDVAEDKQSVNIQVSGQDVNLKVGGWSDWVRFKFPFNQVVAMHGIGRFRLISVEKEIRLYLSPIVFDPENLPPVVDITTPSKFLDNLTAEYGLFKTLGWAIDTWSIAEGTIDEEVFFEDTWFTVDQYQKMLDGLILKDDWDMLIHYFAFPDRIQHMMWRHFDPKHPLYTEEGAKKWGGTILESYQRMDTIVGNVMKNMPKGTKLFIVSDHGFASFRRTMNYNTWLVRNGYMHLNGQEEGEVNLEALFDQGDFFVNVDWSKTKAYAIGLGQIYVNLKGREGQGIVEEGEEYETLVKELKEKLEAYVDPETDEKPVAYVWTRDEVYGTYDPNLIPDLIPSNNDGYRVGWKDSLGGIAKTINADNDRLWSGDHCSVYPPLVNGILFSNMNLVDRQPYMGDLMPTILDIFEAPSNSVMDGQTLLK